MSSKRKAEDSDRHVRGDNEHKKQKRGFHVGPDNLPDGTWRRKTQKIKQGLIEKAKLRKDYEKVKSRQAAAEAEETATPADAATSSAPHPDRQTLIDKQADSPEPAQPRRNDYARERKRKPKPVPFAKEQRAADKAKAEAEERRKRREEAERQRIEKTAERERFRKAMAKARRGGPNGQRKLGRESTVLLEKVRRMVNAT